MQDPLVRVFTWIGEVIGTILGWLLRTLFELIRAYPKVMLPLIALIIVGIVVAVNFGGSQHQASVYSASTTIPVRTPTINAAATNAVATNVAATTSASATMSALAGQATPTTNVARAIQSTPYVPVPGSWVASTTSLHIRFFALPWWVQKPDLSGSDRLSLGTASSGTDFQALDVYRFQNTSGLDGNAAWNAEMSNFSNASGIADFVLTSGPRPQQAAEFNGVIGQYHYLQAGNGVRIDGTLWVGTINGDRVVMNFRCDPAQDQRLDQAITQILATIDFNAI